MAKVFTITEGLENMGALKTGGQGSVYKGRRRGEIITAVKLLPTPIHTEDPKDRSYRDFQNEVNKLKKVNHEPNPNVVKMLNFGITETGSFPFIEMEFIEGPDLEELLQPPHDPVFTVKDAIKLAEHLSNALAHCHRNDVKHGDIKSNNVKYNRHTGNYVLLDFGLAALSDEQRRTSLRHAGAVEFMAPEQSDGELLFQSDIYSFGIILYELLAGVVPFPMNDKGESARNAILIAHRETPPPDLLALRRKNLPGEWSEAKKKREAQLPQWLVSLIYKCLQKKPADRFLNGTDLQEYIITNSTMPVEYSGGDASSKLKQQNRELAGENDRLQKQVVKLQGELKGKDQQLNSLKALVNGNSSGYYTQPGKSRGSTILAAILTLVVLGGISYLIIKDSTPRQSPTQPATSQTEPAKIAAAYRVASGKAYFHDQSDESTKRNAFLSQGDPVQATDERNGFIYTEFTNSRGQVSKGWLKKTDLLTPNEYQRRLQEQQAPEVIYKSQLQQANNLLVNFKVDEALQIYKPLVDKAVPEAMYQYGNLALQDQNNEIDCNDALALVKRASDKGYLPAKTTLGYLYIFAENKDVLQSGNYSRCAINRNVDRGLALLQEAAAGGDNAAQRILDQYNASQGQ